MENYNFDEEKKSHPHKYYGHVKEHETEIGNYLLKSALYYVVDDYDEYLESVEQSHYEDLGYYELTNFNLLDGTTEMDLSWMDSEDVIQLDDNEQIPTIRRMIVNADNLGYSRLSKKFDQLDLVVNGENQKSTYIQQIKGFKSFMEKNGSLLRSVNLNGFPQIMEAVLAVYAKRAGIEVNKEESSPRMHF